MYPIVDEVKRPYRSTRRREQASQTRQRIIRAAHELFINQGYGRTTIAQIAGTAGVAVETVYATYRNKPTLLRNVWYATFRGDEEDVRLLDRPQIQAVLAEPDLAIRLRAQAVVYTPVFRRMTPLLRALQGAATSEQAAAAMLAEFDEQRLDAAGHYARAAAETGQLAVTEQECRDLLAATLDGALWYRLVEERGWSDERYAQLLGTMWVAALVR
jgi:AcrR family transcriptional regulator